VASEIDLMWSYIGGPRGLIDAVLADLWVEALPAAPDDPVSRVEDWVAGWAAELADGLLARGEAALSTPRGSIEAWLRRPSRLHDGELRIRAIGSGGGYRGSHGHLGLRGDEQLRAELTHYLTCSVLDLAVM
jgi:hypothetical protein